VSRPSSRSRDATARTSVRRDPLAPRFGPDVDDIEEPEPRALPRRDGEADLVGEQDDVVEHRLVERRDVLVAVGVAPLRVRDLCLECEPELANERQIVGCGLADHGVRWARRR
jgi:hypothetical protein